MSSSQSCRWPWSLRVSFPSLHSRTAETCAQITTHKKETADRTLCCVCCRLSKSKAKLHLLRSLTSTISFSVNCKVTDEPPPYMMASPKIEVVLEACCPSLGEGPHWDVASQTLLYIDIRTGGVHQYNPQTKQETKITMDGTVGFVIPCERGGCVVGLNRTLSHVDLKTTEVTSLVEVDFNTKNRFNDAKCDSLGRLWAGTVGYEEKPGIVDKAEGSLYCFSADQDHKVSTHLRDLYISNGMDWTDDNRTMYFIDSIPRKVFAFDFDLSEGKIENQRVVVEFEKDTEATYGVPDGMCIDNEGKIWVACFGASRVHRFDPETGKTLQTLEFPCTNITSCCFGGKDLDELYVTTSQYNLKPEQGPQPLAGSLFKVTGLGVKGRAPNNYKG